MGDWGLGMGVWGLGPIPNPQSPIPNPQSPLFYKNYLFLKKNCFKLYNVIINKYFKKNENQKRNKNY